MFFWFLEMLPNIRGGTGQGEDDLLELLARYKVCTHFILNWLRNIENNLNKQI